ncbi:MAG: DUF3987 domain-containing protein [Candidatus Binataceae bacterium]
MDAASLNGSVSNRANAPKSSRMAAAQHYLERGWQIVPLEPSGKKPIHGDWPNRRYGSDNVAQAFGAAPTPNLGLNLGEASQGLADVDLDCSEAVALAPAFLPATDSRFGRASKRSSHWLYTVSPADFRTHQFKDPDLQSGNSEKEMLLELRGTGGQTMAPPSMHPDEELVEWESDGEPAKVSFVQLEMAVRKCAAAALLARHWPSRGGRHGAALALAGSLIRVGWPQSEAEQFVFEVARAANDEEANSRRADVRTTGRKVAAGEAVTAGTTCKEIFGEKVWRSVSDWLGLRPASAQPEWSNPISLEMPLLPEIPQGVLPEWADQFVDAVTVATETPRELAIMMILGTLGACCQNKYEVQVDPGYVEPTNIWTQAVLPPGERKTAVMIAVTKPLRDWERDQAEVVKPEIIRIESERKTRVAQIEALRKKVAQGKDNSVNFVNEIQKIADLEADLPEVPKPPRVWTQDVTPEKLGAMMADNDESMAGISDEGGIFDILAGRYSNGVPNLDLFLQAHSGSPVRVDRGSRPPVIMDHPALTLVLSPQPDVLHGLAAKPGFRGRGLLARFLYALPISRLGYRTGDTTPVPATISDEYARNVRALLEVRRPETGAYTITLTSGARQELREFAAAVEHDLRDGERFEQVRDWAGKLPGAGARIAGLLHCAKHCLGNPDNEAIDLGTMRHALDLAAVLTYHALAAFDLMGADLVVKDARKVWAWIKRQRKSTFTFRDCFRALQGTFPRAEHLEPAIVALVERGYIAPQEKARSTVGRPTRTFEVNPVLAGAWKEEER